MNNEQIDITQFRPFGNLELIAGQMVEGFITGLHKSPFHGFSVEFAEYRPYNTGESTRNIDWKLYGRTDKLFVKQFEEETNLRCQIIIDASSSMFFPKRKKLSLEHPNKIYFSVYAAAAIMQIMKRQRDAVGLSLFSDSILFHSQAKSSAIHLKSLYHELEPLLTPLPIGEQHNTDITNSLHEIAERIHRRSLVIIFSDVFDNSKPEDLFLALQHLKHNKHDVILFHVYDKSLEIDFEFDNKPYKFIDVESGNMLKVNAGEIKPHYKKAIQAFKNELKVRCGQYQVDLVETDINQGYHQLLLTYLLKRQRLF
ncbi:MAG: DUF58 domain-containing protein [Bacteroidales bacterium]|jgi:uncharacterized protein (DUF58 family)|nr:DUF58 domain-containing protein [Bacteroidales bacterium]